MIVVQVGIKLNVKFVVAAPYKNFPNNVNKRIHTFHTEELNNSVLLNSTVNLKRNT
jgi:hypothetical protein